MNDSLYVNRLTPEIANRYKEKLTLYCDNIDPYSINVSMECSQSIEDLPNITTHQIYSYLMLSKCPYSGMQNSNDSIDYSDQSKVGTVLQFFVKKLDDISIVLGEVCIFLLHL